MARYWRTEYTRKHAQIYIPCIWIVLGKHRPRCRQRLPTHCRHYPAKIPYTGTEFLKVYSNQSNLNRIFSPKLRFCSVVWQDIGVLSHLLVKYAQWIKRQSSSYSLSLLCKNNSISHIWPIVIIIFRLLSGTFICSHLLCYLYHGAINVHACILTNSVLITAIFAWNEWSRYIIKM